MKPLFGQIAVELKLLTEEEIERCAELQRTSTTYKPIGQVAMEKGFLTTEQLEECLQLQGAPLMALSFGQIATQQGFMTFEQVETCAKEQLKSLKHKSIGQICIENGLLTRREVEEILAKQIHQEATTDTKIPDIPSPNAPAPQIIQSTSDRSRLLVADDSPTIRHFIKIALHQFYDVTVVPSGNEALREIRNPHRDPFDLFILDIGLPDIDGFDLCEVIKKVPQYLDTPLVLFTSASKPEFEAKAQKLGGLEIWEKKGLREVEALRRKVRSALAAPTPKRG